jgi:glycosyltransferase involved in cell wall biosynthesis
MDKSQLKAVQDNEPLISVIMNCYNGERFLREAVDSVLAQTYENWEIIFWDNQSTDKSREIFKSYKDLRMRYFISYKHTTLGQARNLAVENAKGEWLGFLDCDDIWMPNKLEKQLAVINDNSDILGLVYSEAEYLFEKDIGNTSWGKRLTKLSDIEKFRILPSGNIFSAMLKNNLVPLVTAMVRRSAFIEVGGLSNDFKQAEDYELFVKISKHYEAIAIEDSTCLYRIHENNLSHIQSEDSYKESIAVVQRYIPDPDAIIGARIWQANYAGYLFMHNRYMEGFTQLLNSRNYIFFIKKSILNITHALKKSLGI